MQRRNRENARGRRAWQWAALGGCLSGAVCCGGARPAPVATPAEPPAYTTSDPSPAPATHTMPDGTIMPGHQHGDPGAASHTMPDGTIMPGHQHGDPGAGQHRMADGGVMSGHQHGAGATHVMPDGTIMQGARHGDP